MISVELDQLKDANLGVINLVIRRRSKLLNASKVAQNKPIHETMQMTPSKCTSEAVTLPLAKQLVLKAFQSLGKDHGKASSCTRERQPRLCMSKDIASCIELVRKTWP